MVKKLYAWIILQEQKNIQQWIGHPRFELIRHDVVEPIYLEVDRIWHLACPASPIHYQSNPIKDSQNKLFRNLQYAYLREE